MVFLAADIVAYNEKANLTREAREYRNNYLRNVGKASSEEITLVLSAIFKLCPAEARHDKVSKSWVGATQDEIAAATMLNPPTVKTLLRMLLFPLFVSRVKVGRTWKYVVTSLGEDALPFMLDDTLFPGRKQKIAAILTATRKDGAN